MKESSLPFNWADAFKGGSTGCLVACVAMAAKYWERISYKYASPLTREDWETIIERTKGRGGKTTIRWIQQQIRHISSPKLSRKELLEEDIIANDSLLENVSSVRTQLEDSKDYPPYVFDFIEINDLLDCQIYLSKRPPIPIIVRFDRVYLMKRCTGIPHAAIIERIDIKERKIYLIDPAYIERGRSVIEDLSEFSESWKELGNRAIILIYPACLNIDKLHDNQQKTLDMFFKENNIRKVRK